MWVGATRRSMFEGMRSNWRSSSSGIGEGTITLTSGRRNVVAGGSIMDICWKYERGLIITCHCIGPDGLYIHALFAYLGYTSIRADSRLAPSRWDTLLQSNTVSHWLGANLESALSMACENCITNHFQGYVSPYSKWYGSLLSIPMEKPFLPYYIFRFWCQHTTTLRII